MVRALRLSVRTLAFHAGERGSIPLGRTTPFFSPETLGFHGFDARPAWRYERSQSLALHVLLFLPTDCQLAGRPVMVPIGNKDMSCTTEPGQVKQ